MPDYVTPDQCSFLKRHFIYNPHLGKVTAQLEKDTFYKMLKWTIPSSAKGVTPDVQVTGALTSALWELALIVSPEQHDLFHQEFSRIFSEYYGHGQNPRIPHYQEIIHRIFDLGETNFSYDNSAGELSLD